MAPASLTCMDGVTHDGKAIAGRGRPSLITSKYVWTYSHTCACFTKDASKHVLR